MLLCGLSAQSLFITAINTGTGIDGGPVDIDLDDDGIHDAEAAERYLIAKLN